MARVSQKCVYFLTTEQILKRREHAPVTSTNPLSLILKALNNARCLVVLRANKITLSNNAEGLCLSECKGTMAGNVCAFEFYSSYYTGLIQLCECFVCDA